MKRADALRGADALLVLALTLAAAAMAPLAALIVDSGRDLATAYAIAQGNEFPVYGPSLFGIWRPGPVWFYLLAVPLALFGSVTAAAVFAGVLAAMKIPLAWSLGRRATGPAAGLAFAAFMALPGWTTLAQLVLSHTMLVEAAVLATLWLAYSAGTRHSALLAALAAGMQALAIHAHPTALVAAPAVAWAVWVAIVRPSDATTGSHAAGIGTTPDEVATSGAGRASNAGTPARSHAASRSPPRLRWGWLAIAGLLFLLPFLPALGAEMRSGFPQLTGSATYLGSGDYLMRLDRIDDVLRGALLGQAEFVRDFLLARWPWLGGFVFGGSLLAAAIGAIGVIVGMTRDRRLPGLLVLAAFAWLLVLLLRDATPAWMVYAPMTTLAALLAAGWSWSWSARWREPAARGLALFALVASGALVASRLATVREGEQYLPTASVGDIALAPQRDLPRRFWLPVYAHDAALRRFCAAPGEVSLQGELAVALHFGQGVAADLHCRHDGGAPRIGFGGQPPRALVGVPRLLAGELGIVGEATAWGYVLATPVRVVHPAARVPFATHTRYLVDDYRTRVGRTPAVVRVDTACNPDELIVVTHLLPGLDAPFALREGSDPLPEMRGETIAGRYFACPASGYVGFEIATLDANAVGVALVRRHPGD